MIGTTRRTKGGANCTTTHAHEQVGKINAACLHAAALAAIRERAQLPAREQRVVARAMEILATYMRGPANALTSPDAVKQYLCLQLGRLPYESFGVLCLDAGYHIIQFEALFRGTLTQTSVFPRDVLLQALAHNAAAVILAHNHPSGSVVPSEADKQLTITLRMALSFVGVRVADHVIVSGNRAYSFAEHSLL